MSTTHDAGSRRDRRKQASADAILDAAERLIAEHGYRATQIDAIAAAADVSLGTVYARFDGKTGIYLGLVERAIEVNERYIQDAMASHESVPEQLSAISSAYVSFLRDHPHAMRLVGLRDLEPPLGPRAEETLGRIERRRDAMVRDCAAVIARGVRDGSLRDVDPLPAARFLWGSWNGVIGLNLVGILSDRQLASAVRSGQDLVLRGVVR